MKLSVLEVRFRLQGCTSLKEKRSRMRGLQRLNTGHHLLYFECGNQNSHTMADWVFVAGASSEQTVNQILDQVEDQLADLVDAEILDSQRGDVGL